MHTTLALRFLTFLVIGSFCWPHAGHAARVSIAAVVGDDVITTTDVAERRDLVMTTTGIPMTVENQNKITARIVQLLVDETLETQEAKRSSITVSDEELRKAIDGMQTRGEKPENLREFVKKRGLSMRSLEGQIRSQMLWSKVVQRKLRRNVTVSQDEIRRAQQAATTQPGEEEVRLQALNFDTGDKAKAAAMSKLIEESGLELRSGADMASIATRNIRNSAVRYDPPSWVPVAQLPPMLQQALRTMRDGEVTPPINTGKSMQLLQVMERKTAPKLADNTEYALKQIVIPLPMKRDKASLTKMREVASTLRTNPGECTSEEIPKTALPAKASFVRTQLKAMTMQQRSIVNHLDIGQVSEPLMGTDALRLVVLCEKIEPSTGALPDAEKVRQELFAEKIELEAQKHIRNLRRDAYIDIKGASE